MLLPLIASIWIYNMPAAPIVAAVAVDAAATTATTAALTAITSAAFVATTTGAIISGAIGGAIGGAITGAVEGGDPGMGALTGAISGGAGGGVNVASEGTSPFVGGLEKAAVGTGAGTLAGLATGEKFGQALKSGAVSGIASGIASGVGAALDQGANGPTERAGNERVFGNEIPGGISAPAISTPPPSGSSTSPTERNGIDRQLSGAAQSALSYGIKSGLSDIFGSNVPTPSSPGQSTSPSFNQASVTTPNATNTTTPGNNPSINALTQALTTVGDLGYSPGGPVFGSQSNAPQRKVWNQASLRVTDDTDNQ